MSRKRVLIPCALLLYTLAALLVASYQSEEHVVVGTAYSNHDFFYLRGHLFYMRRDRNAFSIYPGSDAWPIWPDTPRLAPSWERNADIAANRYGFVAAKRRVSEGGPPLRPTRLIGVHLGWLMLLPLGPLALHTLRAYRSRRAKLGQCVALPAPTPVCRHCGYDLRCTPHRCPECGQVTPSGGARPVPIGRIPPRPKRTATPRPAD